MVYWYDYLLQHLYYYVKIRKINVLNGIMLHLSSVITVRLKKLIVRPAVPVPVPVLDLEGSREDAGSPGSPGSPDVLSSR